MLNQDYLPTKKERMNEIKKQKKMLETEIIKYKEEKIKNPDYKLVHKGFNGFTI